MFIRLNQLKIDRKFSYTYNCPQYSPVLSSLNRLIRLQHQSASMYLLQVANQPQLNDIIFSFPMGFCVSFFCSSMFFNALLELLPTPWGRMSQAPCVNHALPLCTPVFGRTMLQRTRTLYDARRTRTLRRHLLLTCLYLLCFKDTVEFSTARAIPTYTAPQQLVCHGAFCDDVSRIRVQYTFISSLLSESLYMCLRVILRIPLQTCITMPLHFLFRS